MASNTAFGLNGVSTTFAYSGTSGGVTLTTGGQSILVSNEGLSTCFINVSTSSLSTAVNNGTNPALLAGTIQTFSVPLGTIYIAAIVTSGGTNGTLWITRGEGL